MPIDFDSGRWERVKRDYKRWWAGELERPLIHATIRGRNPGRPAPAIPGHHFTAFHDPSVPPENIVDRWDYDLSCCRFVGDAFPTIWPNFGPGVMAAFMGATLVPDGRTCWFQPADIREIGDIRFEYKPDNSWLRRVKDICRAAMSRWQGLVQVGMTDLGGNLDILSTFRPSELLPLDICDHPDEVKRLTWEAHRLWWKYFEEINSVLRPINPGYTAWTPIYSETPYYILQCDFSYMIGPAMFEEFVRPELKASCERLGNAFYHLDGIGQLPHLDSLLRIEKLKGIQWVPGDGKPGCDNWPDVYRKIRAAGKLVQVLGGMKELDAVAEQLGSGRGLFVMFSVDASREKEVERFLKKHGAPVGSGT